MTCVQLALHARAASDGRKHLNLLELVGISGRRRRWGTAIMDVSAERPMEERVDQVAVGREEVFSMIASILKHANPNVQTRNPNQTRMTNDE